MREVLFPAGYTEVKTPLIYNKALWETSGHWQHYRAEHVPRRVRRRDDEPEADELPGPLAASSRSETRSYRDLPLRLHEQTPLHRNEASGVLSGLTRVRQFSQDDAHCFVMESQIGDEVERLLRLVQRVYGDFGLTYAVKLVDPARRSSWARSRPGTTPRPQLQGARSTRRAWPTRSTRATARSTARRSTSTSPTPSAASGSARRSSSTTRCRSAST